METGRGKVFLSLKTSRNLCRIKVAGPSVWPTALAGEKVRDVWFIFLLSLCALWLRQEQLYIYSYKHFSVVRRTVSVSDTWWADLLIKSGLLGVQKIYTLNTNPAECPSLRKAEDQVKVGRSIALLRGVRQICEKATNSLVMYVRLSVCPHGKSRPPTERIFTKFGISKFF